MRLKGFFGAFVFLCLTVSCSSNNIIEPGYLIGFESAVPLTEKLFEYPPQMENYFNGTNYGMILDRHESTTAQWLLYFDNDAHKSMSFIIKYNKDSLQELSVDYRDGTSAMIWDNRCVIEFSSANKVGILERKEYFFGINLIENGHIVAFDAVVFYPNGEMLHDEHYEHWMIEEIKGYSFPMVDGEYQDVTEKQTKYMFDEIRKESIGMYMQGTRKNIKCIENLRQQTNLEQQL